MQVVSGACHGIPPVATAGAVPASYLKPSAPLKAPAPMYRATLLMTPR